MPWIVSLAVAAVDSRACLQRKLSLPFPPLLACRANPVAHPCTCLVHMCRIAATGALALAIHGPAFLGESAQEAPPLALPVRFKLHSLTSCSPRQLLQFSNRRLPCVLAVTTLHVIASILKKCWCGCPFSRKYAVECAKFSCCLAFSINSLWLEHSLSARRYFPCGGRRAACPYQCLGSL